VRIVGVVVVVVKRHALVLRIGMEKRCSIINVKGEYRRKE